MSNLSTTVFTKSNSFESFRLINQRTSPSEQSERTILNISQHLSDHPGHHFNTILKKAYEDLVFEKTCKDSNLLGSRNGFTISPLLAEELFGIQDKDLARFLYHRYRYEKQPSTQVLDDHPPCVQIEPSSICNYRCKFCFQTNGEFSDPKSLHMGKMSLEDFKFAVRFIQDKVHIVSLASRGEPTIAPTFESMVDYAEGKFLSLKINTNGSLLTEGLCHKLLRGKQKTIVFSIDSHTKQSYEDTRINGKFERIRKNLNLYLNIKKKFYPDTKTITRISGVYIDESQSMQGMVDTWGEFADQITYVRYNPWENPYDGEQTKIKNPCSDLWRRLFIWHDLKLNTCDSDYMSMLSPGSLKDFSDLKQVWHSSHYKDLRAAHLSKRRSDIMPCSNCAVV